MYKWLRISKTQKICWPSPPSEITVIYLICILNIFAKKIPSKQCVDKLDKITLVKIIVIIVQFSSVSQSCLTLCNPMNRSTPGLPVHHQLLELAQTHVHRVSDAIQPSSVLPFSSCPQSFPASGTFPVSQLFMSGGQSIGASASA